MYRKNNSGIVTVIEARERSIGSFIVELYIHRHLVWFFGIMMLQRRYSGTVLGWLWIIIRPLITSVYFSLIFGRLAGMQDGNLPYLLFFLSGLVIWNFFANATLFMTRSLRSNRRLISKLSFPRIVIPIGSLFPFFVEFLIYFFVLLVASLFYSMRDGRMYIELGVHWSFIAFPFITTLFTLCGLGFITSILNSEARDVRFTLPYLIQLYFFATPILYPLSAYPHRLEWLLGVNPVAMSVAAFRSILFSTPGATITQYITGFIVSLIILVSGLLFFSNSESNMADRF